MRSRGPAALLVLSGFTGVGSLGCSAAQALAPPTTHLGRTLVQTVTAGDSEFSVCVNISSQDHSAFYLTSVVRGQINVALTDSQGHSAVDSPHGFVPGAPVAPPPSGHISSYFILEEHSRLETCYQFRYASFSDDIIHIQSSFQSWLKRDWEVPEPVRRMSIDRQFIGRPLYDDEVLLSNECVVDRRRHRSHCD